MVRGRPVDEFVRSLEGQRFEQPSRHGKWMLAGTRGPTLLIHFGMTGRLRWEARESAALRFDRVDLCLEDGRLVFQDQRNLSGLWLAVDPDEVRQVIGDLGPDAFGLTAQELGERFAGPRMIKALLMDQSVLAGLGNMLSDEVLWRARIHPSRRSNDLEPDEVQALTRSLHRVLTDSVKAGEIPREPTWLASQRSQANPRCPRCRTGLRTNRIAGLDLLLVPYVPGCSASARSSRTHWITARTNEVKTTGGVSLEPSDRKPRTQDRSESNVGEVGTNRGPTYDERTNIMRLIRWPGVLAAAAVLAVSLGSSASAAVAAGSGDTCSAVGQGTAYSLAVNAASAAAPQYGFAVGAASGVTVESIAVPGIEGSFLTSGLPQGTSGTWINSTQLPNGPITVTVTTTGPVKSFSVVPASAPSPRPISIRSSALSPPRGRRPRAPASGLIDQFPTTRLQRHGASR